MKWILIGLLLTGCSPTAKESPMQAEFDEVNYQYVTKQLSDEQYQQRWKEIKNKETELLSRDKK